MRDCVQVLHLRLTFRDLGVDCAGSCEQFRGNQFAAVIWWVNFIRCDNLRRTRPHLFCRLLERLNEPVRGSCVVCGLDGLLDGGHVLSLSLGDAASDGFSGGAAKYLPTHSGGTRASQVTASRKRSY